MSVRDKGVAAMEAWLAVVEDIINELEAKPEPAQPKPITDEEAAWRLRAAVWVANGWVSPCPPFHEWETAEQQYWLAVVAEAKAIYQQPTAVAEEVTRLKAELAESRRVEDCAVRECDAMEQRVFELVEELRRSEKAHSFALRRNQEKDKQIGEWEGKITDLTEERDQWKAKRERSESNYHIVEAHRSKLMHKVGDLEMAVEKAAADRDQWKSRAEAAEARLAPRPVDREELAKVVHRLVQQHYGLSLPWHSDARSRKACGDIADAAIEYLLSRMSEPVGDWEMEYCLLCDDYKELIADNHRLRARLEGQGQHVEIDDLVNAAYQVASGHYETGSPEELEASRRAVSEVARLLGCEVHGGKVFAIGAAPTPTDEELAWEIRNAYTLNGPWLREPPPPFDEWDGLNKIGYFAAARAARRVLCGGKEGE